jgi:hypothetical protein
MRLWANAKSVYLTDGFMRKIILNFLPFVNGFSQKFNNCIFFGLFKKIYLPIMQNLTKGKALEVGPTMNLISYFFLLTL